MFVNRPNSKDLISKVQKYKQDTIFKVPAFSRSLSHFVTSHLHVNTLMFLEMFRSFIPDKSKIYHHIYAIAYMPLIDTLLALCGIALTSLL